MHTQGLGIATFAPYKKEPMATLVTGAGGFLGQILSQRLIANDETVHAMVHNTQKGVVKEEERLKIFQGDVEDMESIRRAMGGCDQVYHLAALATPWVKDHNLFYRVNVTGTDNVIKVAEEKGIEKVLYISTGATLGPQKERSPATEEQSVAPEEAGTHYEKSKILSERLVQKAVQEGRSKAVIVNPTRLYGRGAMRTSNAVTKMIHDYLKGSWRIVPGNGKSVGNYVFTKDVIEGMLLALEHGKAGERYILGGVNKDLSSFFETLAEVTGCRRKMMKVPTPMLILVSRVMKGWANLSGRPPLITPSWVRKYLQNDWGVDCSKAIQDLGYEPHSLEEGFQKTHQWLTENGYLKSHKEQEELEHSS